MKWPLPPVRLALESEGTNDDDMEIPAFGDRRDRRERSERPERPRRERGEPEEGMTRLFIGAGRMERRASGRYRRRHCQ